MGLVKWNLLIVDVKIVGWKLCKFGEFQRNNERLCLEKSICTKDIIYVLLKVNLPKSEPFFVRFSALASKMGQIEKRIAHHIISC